MVMATLLVIRMGHFECPPAGVMSLHTDPTLAGLSWNTRPCEPGDGAGRLSLKVGTKQGGLGIQQVSRQTVHSMVIDLNWFHYGMLS